jgi:predicted nucleic acid-binding protein
VSAHYIIDPSALMQAYIKDTYTLQVKALLTSLEADDAPELHLLEIGLAEAANVLWKHEVIFKRLTPEFSQQVIDNIRALPLHIHLIEAHLDEAMNIGRQHHLAIYDSLYIALARELDFPLITADGKQERIALTAGVSSKALTDFVSSSA